MSTTDWASLKVVDLKAELQGRGLATKGVKAELVKRLVEADAEAAQAREAQASPNGETASPADDMPLEEDAVMQPASEDQPKVVDEVDAISIQGLSHSATIETEDASGPVVREASTLEPVTEIHDPIITSILPHPTTSRDSSYDLQKRKRRSSTPPPATKRARQDEERLVEDREDVVDYDTGDLTGSPEKKLHNGPRDARESDVKSAMDAEYHDAMDPTAVDAQSHVDNSSARAVVTDPSQSFSAASSSARNSGLDVSGEDAFMRRVAIGRQSEAPSQPSQTSQHLSDDRREMSQQSFQEPAPAAVAASPPSALAPTSALYIRELMRPLRSETVMQHILDILTPQDSQPDPDLIEAFFLDQIRTHAFVKLRSISAAQHVRTAMHDQVWPNERNRKPLWVDFIPPESMVEWIQQEESGARGDSQRWEVVYEQTDDGVTAVHRLAGSENKLFSKPPPTGPAAGPDPGPVYPGIEAAPRGPRGRGGPTPRLNVPNLFQTQANPPLTYQPLSEDVAQRRIENMRSFYSSIPSYELGKDYHRYTFEGTDSFVDRGTEVFIGIRPPHREKEHQERLRLERLGLAVPSSAQEFQPRREDYRPPPRLPFSDVDRFSGDRRFGVDRRPRNRGFRGDRGSRFRGEDPYRYRPGY